MLNVWEHHHIYNSNLTYIENGALIKSGTVAVYRICIHSDVMYTQIAFRFSHWCSLLLEMWGALTAPLDLWKKINSPFQWHFFPPLAHSPSLPLLLPMPMKAYESENRAHSHMYVDTLLCSSLFSHRPSNSNKTAQTEAFFLYTHTPHICQTAYPSKIILSHHSNKIMLCSCRLS